MRLFRRTGSKHETVGVLRAEAVVSADYYDFAPGQRVITREGLAGTVDRVEDGPFPGNENYIVTLDHGLGGGQYTSSELHPVRTASVAVVAEEEQHLASEDYPELIDVLVERPPLENEAAFRQVDPGDEGTSHSFVSGQAPARDDVVSTEASWLDRHLWGPIADEIDKRQPPEYRDQEGQYTPSFDWCRFRHNSRCMYPKGVDQEASAVAGYIVWVPEDRGRCLRDKWEDQKACPVAEPGPRSGDPNAQIEVTRTWQQGGQHGGVPDPATPTSDVPFDPTYLNQHASKTAHDDDREGYGSEDPVKHYECPRCGTEVHEWASKCYKCGNDLNENPGRKIGVRDPEFRFHFTSSWRDIQAKAKRIRSEGGVRIISAPGNRGSAYIVGEIKGDTNIYQTTIMRAVGSNSVAMWECGCAWAAYSWGRSGRWRKYEGRMCSHALALTYEAQSRGMFGQPVLEDEKMPAWRADPSIVVQQPGDYKKAGAKTVADRSGKKIHIDSGKRGKWDDEWMKDRPNYGKEYAVTACRLALPVEGAKDREDEEVNCGNCKRVRVGGLRPVALDPELQRAPALLMAQAMLHEGVSPNDVLQKMTLLGVPDSPSLVAEAVSLSFRDLKAKVRGWVHRILQIDTDAGTASVEGVGVVPLSEVHYPTYDPTLGLELRDSMPHVAVRVEVIGHQYDPESTHVHAADCPDLKRKPNYKAERSKEGVWVIDAASQSDAVEQITGSPDDEDNYMHGDIRFFPCIKWGEQKESSSSQTNSIITNTGYHLRKVDHVAKVYPFEDKSRYNMAFVGECGHNLNVMTPTQFEQYGEHFAKKKYRCASCPKTAVKTATNEQPCWRCNGKGWIQKGHDDPAGRWDATCPECKGKGFLKSAAARDGDVADGVMIALRPPEQVCEALVMEDGEPVDNLHITLGYLGKAVDIDRGQLEAAVEDWATRWATMRGTISGYGVFINDAPGAEGHVLYASWDIPGLERARDDLVDTLAKYGLAPRTDHGFTPHQTLTYASDAVPSIPKTVPEAAQGQITFDRVAAVYGPDWAWYPLLGRPGAPVEATLHEEPEPALPYTDGEEGIEEDPPNANGRLADPEHKEAEIQPGDPKLSWLMGDSQGSAKGNGDIAHMARLYLESPETFQREAAKHFTPAEQQQLISEGEDEGVGASNLDRLDISGTHYEALEAALAAQEQQDDDEGLFV